MIHDLDTLLAGNLKQHVHPNVQLKESWKQDAGKWPSVFGNTLDPTCGWIVVGVTDGGVLAGASEHWVRDDGHFGDAPAEKSLTSRLLAKWMKQKKPARLSRGKYQFPNIEGA